jgi:hypothetical protein
LAPRDLLRVLVHPLHDDDIRVASSGHPTACRPKTTSTSGLLSAFLDNAPTNVAFCNMAAHALMMLTCARRLARRLYSKIVFWAFTFPEPLLESRHARCPFLLGSAVGRHPPTSLSPGPMGQAPARVGDDDN